MFEGLKDMGKLVKQAKDMKSKMKKIQDELKTLEVTGEAPGFQVVMSGELDVIRIRINPDAVKEGNAGKLEKSAVQAFNDAAKKAKNLATTRLSALSGDFNIPGLG